jgi:hypothetical protein
VAINDTERLLSTIGALIDGYTTDDDTVSPDAMRSAPQPPASEYGDVIDIYTRADAIADGILIEAPADLVRDARLRAPVALTLAAWEDCVAWDEEEDNRRKGIANDETGRLWDVLWMAANAIRGLRGSAHRTRFTLYRVPRPGRARAPRQVSLDIVAGPGDDGELVLTIMQPNED